MKILIKQFLGQSHSWSIVGWGISRALKKLNHKIELFATDGIKHIPNDLKENIIGYTELDQPKVFGNNPDKDYDMQISYTSMKNFPAYLQYGDKNRFGIWTSEWDGKNILPSGFAKHYQACDLILAPSNFSKQIFINSKIPEEKIKVISHGVDSELFSNESKIKLPTNKKFKILSNIAQNHIRKNIPGLLQAYGTAFNKNDDVCLILKAKPKKPTMVFDVSLDDCLKDFKKNFPDHAEIKIFNSFVEDISELYRSVDATFTMSHGEGFYFPGLESLASGKINIAPAHGGQLDFLNEKNALLISGVIVRADPRSMYWEQKSDALWFQPDIQDAAYKLKYAYSNFEKLNSVLELNRRKIISNYSWNNIANQIVELSK